MTSCQEFIEIIDDYLDNNLDKYQKVEADQHIETCAACQTRLANARQLLKELKNISVPQMSPGFAQRAIKQASQHEQPNKHHRRGFITGFSSAIAAGLVLALVVGGLLPTEQAGQSPMQVASTVPDPIPEISLSVEQVQMVNLVFDSTHAVANAELSISLPPHVELSGYPGQHSLAWRSDIKQGRNVLSLPIKGITKANGELVAQINSNGKIKSIRIQLQVDGNGIPHAVIHAPTNNLS